MLLDFSKYRERPRIWTDYRCIALTAVTAYLLMSSLQLLHVCRATYFTNSWAVRVEGGEGVARHLADKHGFTYVDKVRNESKE